MTQTGKIFRARVLTALDDDSLFFLPDARLELSPQGRILKLDSWEAGGDVTELSDEHGLMTLIPPFCDVHFHWVQDKVMAMGKENLLDWLKTYVFPEEARFASEEYARDMAADFFLRLARRGTLGGGVYASVHEPSVRQAFLNASGHFRIGNVIMTENSPKALVQSFEEASALVEEALQIYGDRYILTPRFALSCEPKIMQELGRLSSEYGAWVQTHLSETTQEIEETLKMYRAFEGFEDVSSYLEVYDRVGLVHERAIFGHCIHMTDTELKHMAKTGAKIAHCPTSNAPTAEKGLGSGLMDLDRIQEAGVSWALATDIGAGPYLSMLDVMRSFLMQHRQAGRDVSASMALYRATEAAFSLMGYDQVGQFTPGHEGSFLALSSKDKGNDPEEWLEGILSQRRETLDQMPMRTFLAGNEI